MCTMHLERGDHVCSLYSTTAELVDEAAGFLLDGLSRGERCWYIGTGLQIAAIQAALQAAGQDVGAAVAREALILMPGEGAYVIEGEFDPEHTMRVFNDAIEQAYNQGFVGFRAAADMSWVLDAEDAAEQLIVYEALLRSLFATCRAIGLCLYDRRRMPLRIIDGAIATHPIAGCAGHLAENPFYDPQRQHIGVVDGNQAGRRLRHFERGEA